jgi:hypothetical protein
MRLFSGKITPLSEELVKALADNHDIECEHRKEVVKDLESVFTNYLALDKEASDKAKDMVTSRGLPQSEFTRLRKLAAEQKGIKVGDETLDYLLDQIVEMLMHSNNVEEVFVEDVELRRKMAPIFKKHMAADTTLDAEVRAQIRHVREGTREWEIEYARVLERVKRTKGL